MQQVSQVQADRPPMQTAADSIANRLNYLLTKAAGIGVIVEEGYGGVITRAFGGVPPIGFGNSSKLSAVRAGSFGSIDEKIDELEKVLDSVDSRIRELLERLNDIV